MAVSKKPTQKRGRKPLWDELDMPSKLDSIEGWAIQGSTDVEICEMLGISQDTFYRWKKDKSEFSEALKRGKDVANGELINRAFKEAMGYKYKEQIGVPGGYVVEVEKYARSNPTMLQFMLKNRMPDDFKDRQQLEHSGPNGAPIQIQHRHDLTKLSDEELRLLEQFLDKTTPD